MTYCFVGRDEASGRPPAPRWSGPRGEYASELDQLCLDIPAPLHAAETAFWAELTGWPHRPSTDSAEFSRLVRPEPLPLQLLLQRLDDGADQTAAHLDLACADPGAEVERHLALGAHVEYEGRGWHTLTDPAGLRYCITARTPH